MIYSTTPYAIIACLVTMFGVFALFMGANSRSRFWVNFWFAIGSVALGVMICMWLIANVVRLT